MGLIRLNKEHHVHFSGGSGLGKDNNIMIQPQRHGQIDAHLGFLQLRHRYHVEFSVPWNVCVHGDGKSPAPAIVTGKDNPNCRIIDVGQEKDGLRLKVELLAFKEKILKDEVQIMCCNAGTPLKIQLNARVLGKDKGTPLLRNGIRSVAVEGSDEDEVLGTKLRASLSMQNRQKL
ncbi:adipose-secreted signaling protein isoform X3 [Andrena cerasifolii]|uniref:adipose-secreted signaling protein isoform X3 n=1 Tax=Andrena cerasifolii TaxID=2819439 RepID=UPI0040384394